MARTSQAMTKQQLPCHLRFILTPMQHFPELRSDEKPAGIDVPPVPDQHFAKQDQRARGRRIIPLPADTDVSTPKYLRDKYAIVGVGETTYTPGADLASRALGTWALGNAAADGGIRTSDIDGMLSYSNNDSTS